MWPFYTDLLYRSFKSIPLALGSTWLGIVFPIFSVLISETLAVWVFGWTAMKKNWQKAIGVGFAGLGVSYTLLFVWCAFTMNYEDHKTLASNVEHLQGFAAKEDLFEHELSAAQSKADNWQQAYQGILKKEQVPDRILNAEESDKLHANLVRDAKAITDRTRLRLDISPAFYEDRESAKFASQILRVFQESRWDARWPTSHSKNLIASFYASPPTGILVYSDNRPTAEWIVLELRDAGIDANAPYNPPADANRTVVDVKGTMVLVGYKQFP